MFATPGLDFHIFFFLQSSPNLFVRELQNQASTDCVYALPEARQTIILLYFFNKMQAKLVQIMILSVCIFRCVNLWG